MTENELIDTAEKAAKLLNAGNVPAYEIYVRGSASTSVEVKEQKLDAFEQSETWGIGIRVLLADGRMGFAYSTGSTEAVSEAVAKAAENAASSEPDGYNNIPSPPASAYPDFAEFDAGINDITEQDRIARAMTLEKAALDFDRRVTKVRKSSASFTEARWALVSSTGVRAVSKGTYFSCGIMVVAEESGDSQMGYDFDYKRRGGEIDFARVGRNAAERAVSLLGAKKGPSGLFPVVLDNMVSGEFLGVLASSFSAESLLKGKSLFRDKLGKVICSKLINIYDDGLLPGGAGSRAFDDEGMPSQRTPLMVEGRLTGFLHNSYTAKKSGAVSTGNAGRGGFRSQPGVGSTNLYIEKGSVTPGSIISSVSSGLLVQEVLGMHTANPISGDFSVGVSGQWIEGGKVSYPVREMAISGNILSMFSEVEAIADDLRFAGRLGAPSILLRPISVSGS